MHSLVDKVRYVEMLIMHQGNSTHLNTPSLYTQRIMLKHYGLGKQLKLLILTACLKRLPNQVFL